MIGSDQHLQNIERIPVAITSWYGQNQEIRVHINNMEEEGLN